MIDPDILQQLACVRASGRANMMSRRDVRDVADVNGYYALYLFAQECGEDRREGGKRWIEALRAMPAEADPELCPDV